MPTHPAFALYDRDWLASPEFRRRLLVTLAALVAYRVLAHMPVPGLAPEAIAQFLPTSGAHAPRSSLFAGSGLERLSVMALGILPYFSVFALLEIVRLAVPPFRRWLAEAPLRRLTVMRTMVAFAIIMALVQSAGIATALEQMPGLVREKGLEFRIGVFVALTGGVVIAIALTQMIDRYGLGWGLVTVMAVQYVPQLLVSPVAALEAINAGRTGPGGLAFVLAYYIAGIAIFVALAGGRGWIGAAGGQPVNPGRFWPPYLAAIAGPWLMLPVFWLGRTLPGNVVFWISIAASAALTFVFCWLYEREQRAACSPGSDGSGSVSRAVIPAAAFVLLTGFWQGAWSFLPIPGLMSPFVVALVVYTLLHWLRPPA